MVCLVEDFHVCDICHVAMFNHEIGDEDKWLESMELECEEGSPEGRRREADRDRKFCKRLRDRIAAGIPLKKEDIRVRLPLWLV